MPWPIGILLAVTVFVTGFTAGRYLFPYPKYLAETEASKKCKDLGGDFQVTYDYDFSQGKHNSKMVFLCTNPSKLLFKY